MCFLCVCALIQLSATDFQLNDKYYRYLRVLHTTIRQMHHTKEINYQHSKVVAQLALQLS